MAGDGIVKPPYPFLSGPNENRQHQRGLGGRGEQRFRQVDAGLRERREENQAGHDGDVLEQQHAHGLASRARVQFETFREHLGDDGGGGHRHGQSHHQAGLPVLAIAQPGHDAGRRGRDEQLRGAEAEHQLAHRFQPLQAEFEADREHQEDDAEFRDGFDLVAFLEGAQAVRTKQHPDREIGQHRRNLETAGDGQRGDGGR
jgi:hypothetical protein